MMKVSSAPTTEQTRKASAQGRAGPPRRILVVEDESDIRSFNAEVLRRSGYQVDTAEDGEAGWKALHAIGYDLDSFDLLITDNDMPKVTGVELVRKLRAARMELPVVMATGMLPAPDPSLSPWLQPAAILLKPYTADALLGTVRDVLHATDNPRGQIAQFSDSRRQPLADGLQL